MPTRWLDLSRADPALREVPLAVVDVQDLHDVAILQSLDLPIRVTVRVLSDARADLFDVPHRLGCEDYFSHLAWRFFASADVYVRPASLSDADARLKTKLDGQPSVELINRLWRVPERRKLESARGDGWSDTLHSRASDRGGWHFQSVHQGPEHVLAAFLHGDELVHERLA